MSHTLCGGPSEIKPVGQAALQVLSPDALVDLLAGGGLTWLTTAAYAVGYLTFDLSGLCTVDPPALPTIDGPRFEGYFNPLNPQGAAQLREDVTAVVGYILWFLYCQCTSVTTPAQGPLPPQPTGVAVDQPSVSLAGGSPCGGYAVWNTTLGFDTFGNATHSYVQGSSFPTAPLWVQIPISAAMLSGTSVYPVTWTFQFYDQANATVKGQQTYTQTADIPSSAAFKLSYALPDGATQLHVALHTAAASPGSFEIVTQPVVFCTAVPAGVAQSCCPPDPTQLALLSQILQAVTLIQRQQVPFAYAEGTVHSGLTGNGVLSVQGLLGVKIAPGALPPDVGVDPGAVDTYWLDSWINWGNADGFRPPENLRVSPQISLPELAGQYTQVAYSLRPGLTVDITELVREP